MTSLAIRRDTDEWRNARRAYITSTDLPVILGLSPYRAEADLAVEKNEGREEETDPKRRRLMDLGKRLEDVIRVTDEEEHGIRLRKVNRFIVHPKIEWAATSLDFERVGERVIVEAKASRSKRWDDGLPQDVEAQVRWQMGVAGFPRAHVALLRAGTDLECFDVEHDPDTFDGLLDIASDFRARLAAGGPFAQSPESVKRRYPRDNGAEMVADGDLEAAVAGYVAARERITLAESDKDRFETAIKGRMGAVAVLAGPGFHVTWKHTKDITNTEWKAVVAALGGAVSPALIDMHTKTKPGFRPFRVVLAREEV